MSVIDHVAKHAKKLLTPPIPESLLSPFQTRLIKGTRAIRSMKAKFNRRRSFPEKVADSMTHVSGSITFLFVNMIWFTVWILINLGYVEGIEPFDPYPFGLLTMVVSLEAIILSIIVLVSQNREQKINELREEIDLEIDVISESEITKVMELVAKIAVKNGIDISDDKELAEMLKPLHKAKIESSLEKEIMSK